MTREIRFAAFVREITVDQWEIEFDELVPTIETDAAGEPIPHRPTRLKPQPLAQTLKREKGIADEIFEFIYFEARIDQPHGGLMYMSGIDSYVPLTVPEDLPEEDE